MIYPKPYSIYLRETIEVWGLGLGLRVLEFKALELRV